MKNLHIFFLTACMALFCPAWAAVVSQQQARQIAARFMSSNSGVAPAMRLVQQAPALNASAAAPFYVFNADRAQGGYVIVAGDDRVPAVLAYSDNGVFDTQDVPEAMQGLLEGYAAQMAALDQGGQAAEHISAAGRIAPMVPAQWSQNAPFNLLLPTLPEGNHAYVGCVATAMAQVMHYWRWPARPRMAVSAYVTETLGFNMPALPVVDFNWDITQNTYLTDDASAAAMAAALVSQYCAQAVQMDFQKNASSATTSDVPLAMFLYFNYSPSCHYVQRKYFSTEQWENMILDELAAGRPVIYRGSKKSGGHAYVCDGYDGNGMFHINWGWNGKSNGYFLLNVLNPDLQGTGSASGTYGYIIDQGAVFGLKPAQASDPIPDLEVYVRNFEVQSRTAARSSVNSDFSIEQSTQFLNCSDDPIDFDFGWGLYQDDVLVKMLGTGTRSGLNSWYYFTNSSTLTFGNGIKSGTYRIKPMYGEPYSSNLKPCLGSDVNYVDVVINDLNCTIIGHGTAATADYVVNDIQVEGNMHPGRPIDVTLDVTNKGNTSNNLIYMFVGAKLESIGFVDLPTGASGKVTFRYMPAAAGLARLTFTLDEDAQKQIAHKEITINEMPAANLTGSARALNVTNASQRIITAREFALEVTVTNVGNTTYDEDISVKLYKRTHGTTGTLVQALNQHVVLEPQQTKTVTFHCDNVMDGWRYFAKTYFYSSGEQLALASIGTHTIVFPAATLPGDVNGDGEVTVADVNAIINMILTGEHNTLGDVNGDGEISLADVNAVIDLIIK